MRPCRHCIPVPQDTPYVGPPRPDPEENISRLHLCHGVWLETSHPLLSLIGEGGDLRRLCCHLADHVFRLLGVLVGGPCIQTRIHQGGSCHMGFSWRPRILLLYMVGALVLCRCRPLALAVPPFRCVDKLWGVFSFSLTSWGVFILHHLFLLGIMGGLYFPLGVFILASQTS